MSFEETRYPVIHTPSWVEAVRRQGTTYPATGAQGVKDSVNRAQPPATPAPLGVQALQAEIAANGARQTAIKAELGVLEEAYQAAALRWDTEQVQAAYLEMNACADRRRGLQHELADLADDAPRLRSRLQAAQRAQRDAEHVADLEAIERALDEFGPIVEVYRQAALDLVVLADELVQRRQEINRLRRRTVDWSDHAGAAKCPRDINREAAIPPFEPVWLQGGPRQVADCKKSMGLD